MYIFLSFFFLMSVFIPSPPLRKRWNWRTPENREREEMAGSEILPLAKDGIFDGLRILSRDPVDPVT